MITLRSGGGQRGNWREKAAICGLGRVGGANLLVCAQGLQRGVDQGLNVSVGVVVGKVLRCCGAVGRDGLVFAVELEKEVAANEMEDGIGRVFFFQGRRDLQGLLVFLVVVVEANGEIEAGFDWSKRAFDNGAIELADAFLFVAAGNAHEEAKHFRHRGKRVGVVVVEAEAEVGVGEVGVKRLGADEAFAGADSVAGGGFRFAA